MIAAGLVRLLPMGVVDGVIHREEGRVAPLHQADIVAQALEEALIEVGVGVDQAGITTRPRPSNHFQVVGG